MIDKQGSTRLNKKDSQSQQLHMILQIERNIIGKKVSWETWRTVYVSMVLFKKKSEVNLIRGGR